MFDGVIIEFTIKSVDEGCLTLAFCLHLFFLCNNIVNHKLIFCYNIYKTGDELYG